MGKQLIIFISLLVISLAVTGFFILKPETKEIQTCGEGTVLYGDNLCWQVTVNSSNLLTWDQANSYCESLVLSEKENWRLPSVEELSGLVVERTSEVSINETYFPGTLPTHYWTSSKYTNAEGMHWYIHFELGHQGFARDFNKYPVRCVRNYLF